MKKGIKKFFKIIGNIIKCLIIVALIAGIVFGVKLYREYGDDVKAMRSKALTIAEESDRSDFTGGQTTVIYDANGELIASLRSEKEAYYMDYDELPKVAIDVMVVTEDRKFYKHKGVDYLGVLRAVTEYLKNGGKATQGASTITQQLARNTYLSFEVSMDRKITEIFLAMELEKKYSKHDIMEFYLNNIYFGNGFYGLQAAALGYFGKSARELTLSETIYLCAIPNNPSLYDPYKHHDYTLARRDRMLKQLYEFKKISDEEYGEALAAEMTFNSIPDARYNYAETYSRYCAVRALMQNSGFKFKLYFNSSEEEAEYEESYEAAYNYWQQKMYTGGYRIYTSLDLSLQETLQKAVDDNFLTHDEKNEDGVYELQASATCIDNATGLVVAIVGGREQEGMGFTLNRAYQSFRQPGSAIKPLIVYTPSFERGLGPEDIVVDEYDSKGPKNANGKYEGEITVRYAVEKSKNTIAWQLFRELTPAVGLDYLRRMNFRKILPEDENLASAIGGLTIGVSSLEMASAYATLANEGIYRTPTCITSITDSNGVVIADRPVQEKKIYEREAALTMTNVLYGVINEPHGTGHKFQPENTTAAGKTGTTNDQKDGWFCGYTEDYTTAVWVGFDYPRVIDDLSKSSAPGNIWKRFIDSIYENKAGF